MRKPVWINWLYIISQIGLIMILLAAGYLTLSNHPVQGDRPVPDITVNLAGKQVREHCTYCHPDGSRPAADLAQFFISEHPDISPHQWEKLGCTACHLGEGMALDIEISHGLPGLGARTVLKGKDLQASCYSCHKMGPLSGAEKAWQGYQIFITKACNSCHQVSGLGWAGRYGPDLSHIGSLLGVEQIQQAIREPRANLPNSIMPRFPLSKGQARNVAYFLKSRVKDPFYATPMQLQAGQIELPEVDLLPSGQDLAACEKLLYQKQCLACHQFRDINGRIAPDLSFIGSLRDRHYIEGFLSRPTAYISNAVMPPIPLSAPEQAQLVDFLVNEAIAPADLSMHLAKKSGQAESEKQLYMRLCQACHAAEGNGKGALQPNLANFPRAFTGNGEFFRRARRQRLLASLEKGIPGTSMPGYTKVLSADQRERLLDMIFKAFVGVALDDKQPLPALPNPPLQVEASAELFLDRCARCHGVTGTGRGDEALDHLPRPRNLTNSRYFEQLSDERIARAIFSGISGTAMPAFGNDLTADQLWGLVAKVRQLAKARQDD